MQKVTPISIALRTTLLIGLLVLLLLTVVQLFFTPIGWGVVLLSALLFSGAAFGIIYFAIEAFINQKIKVIYKTIHTLQSPKSPVDVEVNMNRDVLGDVNREVENWAKAKASEIRELRRRDDFRREFIGNLAHELKTPIFNIQGYILTLIEGALEDPEINHKFLMRASKSVDRMILITNDLDTISQLESGNTAIAQKRVDIVELAREVIDGAEMSAREKRIKVQLSQKSEKPIWVKVDPFRISQVLINLVGNAISYGTEQGECTISFDDLDENILVEVSDDGPGIAPEHLPRLFERFYRVDKSRSKNAGGTGLGLSIAKHIVEAHGQSITVRSKLGQGSIFTFTLEKA